MASNQCRNLSSPHRVGAARARHFNPPTATARDRLDFEQINR
jgi:hypothetical protein